MLRSHHEYDVKSVLISIARFKSKLVAYSYRILTVVPGFNPADWRGSFISPLACFVE